MRIQFTNDPEGQVELLKRDNVAGLRTISFQHYEFYSSRPSNIRLLAVLGHCSGRPVAIITKDEPQARQLIEAFESLDEVESLAERLHSPVLSLDTPVHLKPTHIAKPWGQEVWFTGMEVRGVSGVGCVRYSIPLPWLLSLMPNTFSAGQPEQLTLLKILDPLPDEVFGDLYFEMHERKQEVYVVTHIDKRAWPKGVGGIRFGFNQKLRAEYSNDVEFKAAYLSSVKRYEKVRREIDACLDIEKKRDGLAVNEPVQPQQTKCWMKGLSVKLVEQEARLREQMNAFSNLMPLKVGDVVQVPCMTPHSLLHGVRTVEFQTPVYERKILSFAQKVLTQDSWDTEEALQAAKLDIDPSVPAEKVELTRGLTSQLIVNFDDFKVWRIRAEQSVDYALPSVGVYRLLMAVSDGLTLADQKMAAEQAALIPANAGSQSRLRMPAGAVALLAEPNNANC
ncbi:hypothetical protein [Gilvimarinus chinensis]|uniref:hypothetical protein n=1 Tax=Gilvimarinus chinensis TaxID=396005 RepID=UPI0012FB297F|nr:hypothetical protein [Gilvimarinus chinensis]